MSPRIRAFYFVPFFFILFSLSSYLASSPPFSPQPTPEFTPSSQDAPVLIDSQPPAALERSPTAVLAAAFVPTQASTATSQGEEPLSGSGGDALPVDAMPAEALTEQPPPPAPVSAEDIALQKSIFIELWGVVNENYLYRDFNGLDWNTVRREYQQQIENGMSFDDFYAAMGEMIARLGDDHSFYLNPDQVAVEDARYAGNYDYVGIGNLLTPVKERERAVVLLTFPKGGAEQAGLKAHDSILAVNGESILTETGQLKNLIRGPAGTQVMLTVQTPGEPVRQVPATRQRITGSMPVPYTVLTTPDGKRIGYIFLVTFADRSVDLKVADALKAMTAVGALDGLILDNRYNEGGADTVLRSLLSYFTGGVVGHFINRTGEHALEIRPADLHGSQSLPLVVLVGTQTYSYGEVFAGILQDLGRAVIVGETTGGNIETLKGFNFRDKSRAWVAYTTFRPLNQPQQNWEETGIVPDLHASGSWDQFYLEDDPAVRAALQALSGE